MREFTVAAEAAFAAGNVRLVALAELDFASGAVRANSSNMTIAFDSGDGVVDFLGIGNFGGLGAVEESGELKAQSLELRLSGVDPAMLSRVLGEDYQGRQARVWLAALDANYGLIDAPLLVWDGLMDTMPIALGATEGSISIVTQSYLARWEQSTAERSNNATQQERYPGDRGLEFVEQMVEKTIIWPA